MDTIEKLKILSDDSRYDMACACGSTNEDRRKRGLDGKWLYPVTIPNGGYSILLKTLLSNSCSNDCKYCPIRSDADILRCTLKPEETANLFIDYIQKKKVFGLFLSSGVKEMLADSHPEFYPVRINRADKRSLLRVPGLGPSTVDIILKKRLHGKITQLEDLGIKGKRFENAKKYLIIE
jgi:predicted DNA-binding helix-hairpin-helix protein